ncbi:MAG TPA: hypothetical protein VL593_19865 [Ramlibacter sp.]|nr:hypothetical protein [Ramlibacter sp.]
MKKPRDDSAQELSFEMNPAYSPDAPTRPRLKLGSPDEPALEIPGDEILAGQLGTFREEQSRDQIANPSGIHAEQPMRAGNQERLLKSKPAAPGPVLPPLGGPPEPLTPAQVQARDRAIDKLVDTFSRQPNSPESLDTLGKRLEFFRPLHETEGHFLYEGICDRLVKLAPAKLNFLHAQKQWPYLSDLAYVALALQEMGPDPDATNLPVSSEAQAKNKRQQEIGGSMRRIVDGCARFGSPGDCPMLMKGLALLVKQYPDAVSHQGHLQACLAKWSDDQLQRLSVLTEGGIPSFPDVSASKILAERKQPQ